MDRSQPLDSLCADLCCRGDAPNSHGRSALVGRTNGAYMMRELKQIKSGQAKGLPLDCCKWLTTGRIRVEHQQAPQWVSLQATPRSLWLLGLTVQS